MREARADTELDRQALVQRAESLVESAPEEARSLASRALEELDRGPVAARGLLVLGRVALGEASYEQAEAVLLRALDRAQEADARSVMIGALRALLRCGFMTRNPDEALLRGVQALSLAREAGLRTSEAQVHNDLGLVYGNLGDFEGALEHLLSGLRISRQEGSPQLASLLNNIGNVYLELDDHREALTFFADAAQLFRGEGARRGEAIAEGNRGRALAGMRRREEALYAFERSVAIYEEEGDPTYLPPALTRVATALAALGRSDEAARVFDRAFELLEQSGHREFEDEVLADAGRFHLERGEPDPAIDLLMAALDRSPADETTRRVYELHHALSEAHEQRNDLSAALASYKEYHRISQAVADSAITVRIRGLMLQFDVERARQQEEIYRLRNVELAQANQDLQSLQERLEAKNRELQQISIEDPLTGLHNRRYLDMQLTIEVSRATRHRQPLSIAMCDIDHFKEVNDRFSHALGDEVLRRLADLVRNAARLSDTVARFGGEEFVLIFPDTDRLGAEIMAERLRTLVAEHDWGALQPGLQITLSIGVAELDDSMDARTLLAIADARLYDAKRAGRDRVVV